MGKVLILASSVQDGAENHRLPDLPASRHARLSPPDTAHRPSRQEDETSLYIWQSCSVADPGSEIRSRDPGIREG